VQDYLKVQDSLKIDGGWRLDWEEDGRWVEWRLDEEAQSEDERFRVVMEWKRYLDARGRTNTNLWEEDEEKTSGFNRGSSSWWREQYYSYEYAGAGGVSSMSAVKEAADTLEISDAGDAGAVRANYLRLVNVWHPDRYLPLFLSLSLSRFLFPFLSLSLSLCRCLPLFVFAQTFLYSCPDMS
jgi:hypothetical protein